MPKGLDCAVDIGDKAQQIKDAGYDFVCRYYLPGSRWRVPLTAQETIKLCSAGLYIVSVYEGNPTYPQYFDASRAVYDMRIASEQAVAALQPFNTPIYYAVDYDAKPNDVYSYFEQMRRVASPSFEVAAYGSKEVLDSLKKLGFIKCGWESGSTGWAGYSGALNSEEIQQGREVTLFGIDIDEDTSNGNGGGWRINT